MSDSLTKEQLIEYVKKAKVKIKKLEASVEEKETENVDLKQQLADAKSGAGVSASSSSLSADVQLKALQDQLDEKSKEIFALTKKHNEELEKLKGDGGATSNTSSSTPKDEEINALTLKAKKYNALVKSKMKEIESKDAEIAKLQESLASSTATAASSDASKEQSNKVMARIGDDILGPKPFVVIKRIECNELKNVEMGGSISGAVSGFLGSALGSAVHEAVGGDNDPFVNLWVADTWGFKTCSIDGGGSDVAWDNLDLMIDLKNIVDNDNEISMEVYDENTTLANVKIGSAILSIDILLMNPLHEVEIAIDVCDDEGVKSGAVKVLAALMPTPKQIDVSKLPKPHKDSSQENSQKITDLEAELSKMKEVVAQREQALLANTTAMSDSMKETDEKDTTISELQQQVNLLQSDLKDKEDTLRKVQAEAVNGSELDVLATQIAGLQDELKEKDLIIEEFKREGEVLATKQGELEKTTKKLKQMYKKKEEELNVLKETTSGVGDADALNKEIETLKEEHQAAIESSTSQAENTRKSLSEEIETLKASLAFKAQEVDSLTKGGETSEALQSEILRLKSELENAKGEVETKSEELRIVVEEKNDKESRLTASCKTALEKLKFTEASRAETEERLASLEKDVEESKADNAILREYIASAEAKTNHDTEATAQVERAYKELMSTHSDQKSKLEAMEQELEKAKAELLKLRSDHDSLTKNLEETEEVCTGLEEELAELRTQHSLSSSEEMTALQKQVDEANAKVAEMEALRSESADTKRKLEELTESHTNRNNEMEELEKRNASIHEEHSILIESIHKKHTVAIDALKNEIGDAQELIRKASNELVEKEELSATLTKELNDLKESQTSSEKEKLEAAEALCESQKLEIDQFQSEIGELSKTMETTNHELDELNEVIAGLEEEMKEKDEEIVILQNAKESFSDTAAAVTDTTSELDKIKKEYEDLKDCLTRKEAELNETRADMEKIQNELNSVLEGAETESRVALEGAKIENASLQEKISSLRIELKGSQDAMEAVKGDLAAAAASSLASTEQKKEIEKLEAEDKANKQKILKMKKMIQERDKNLTEKSAALEEFSKQLGEMGSVNDLYKSKLENALNDAGDAREKGDEFRRKLLEVEAQLEELESQQAQVEANAKRFVPIADVDALKSQKTVLEQQLAELEAANKDIEAEFKGKNSEIDELNEVVEGLERELANLKSELATAQEKIDQTAVATAATETTNTASADEESKRSADLEESMTALTKEKESLLAKVEELESKDVASADKVKKLKVLLTKQKKVTEDKDADIAKMKEDHQSALESASTQCSSRPSTCTVKSRMLLDQEGWAFVYEEPSEKCRWIQESMVVKWGADGTVVVNNCEEYVNVSLQKKLTETQLSYENEIEYLKTEIDENEKKFVAYKERAQQALKKLTKDEQEMKKKAQQAEDSHIQVYVDKIEALEAKLGASEEEIRTIIETSNSRASDLRIANEKIESLESTQVKDAQRTLELEETMKELSLKFESQSKFNDEEMIKVRKDYEEQLEKQRQSYEESKKLSRSPSGTSLAMQMLVTEPPSPVPTAAPDEPPSLPSVTSTSSSNVDIKSDNNIINSSSNIGSTYESQLDRYQSNRNDLLAATPAYSKRNNTSVLMKKTEDEFRGHVDYLQQENANLNAAYIQVKEEIALVLEQENVFKDTIRDLENALKREKEVKGEDRKMNMDYFINIMKRFLLSNNHEEKCKLVPVIMGILHFNANDVTEIKKKWTFNRRGLIGMLLPIPPPDPVDENGMPLYDPNAHGVGSYGSY